MRNLRKSERIHSFSDTTATLHESQDHSNWYRTVLSVVLLLLLGSQLDLWRSPFWAKFLRMWPLFFNPTIWGSHIPSFWMVYAGCVFVASIYPFRTWMSGSFESVWWNACVHRLDFGLYSHPKEFWGNGARTHVNSKENIPSIGASEEVRACDTASCRTERPTHYQLSYSGPQVCHTKSLKEINANVPM